MHRQYSIFDKMCLNIDSALRGICGTPHTTGRPYPAKSMPTDILTENQRKHAASLMRINHTGEVCAQALYHGQGLATRRTDIQQKMQDAMLEEGDHLAWCQTRIKELGSHTSYLNPFWYLNSFMIGLTAGLIGDQWSLGFLAETETQVVKHLENQIALLPEQDQKSAAILKTMQIDEAQHHDDAITAGAVELPKFIKKLMGIASTVMVKTSYWI